MFPVRLCLRGPGKVKDGRNFSSEKFHSLASLIFILALLSKATPKNPISGSIREVTGSKLSVYYFCTLIAIYIIKRSQSVGILPRVLKQNLEGSVGRADRGIVNAAIGWGNSSHSLKA